MEATGVVVVVMVVVDVVLVAMGLLSHHWQPHLLCQPLAQLVLHVTLGPPSPLPLLPPLHLSWAVGVGLGSIRGTTGVVVPVPIRC